MYRLGKNQGIMRGIHLIRVRGLSEIHDLGLGRAEKLGTLNQRDVKAEGGLD